MSTKPITRNAWVSAPVNFGSAWGSRKSVKQRPNTMIPTVTHSRSLRAADPVGERAGEQREDAEEHHADDLHDHEVGVAEAETRIELRGERRRIERGAVGLGRGLAAAEAVARSAAFVPYDSVKFVIR